MKKLFAFFAILFIPALIVTFLVFLTQRGNVAVFNPQGLIAFEERNLIVLAMTIMLSVAIPVVLATFFIAWHFRQDNPKAHYKPEWTGNLYLKALWWAILVVLLIVFSCIVWIAAHRLDPYKPIPSKTAPMTIQVVALRWKWLFIYPKEQIATVNYVQFPVNTPVHFSLTADAPMSSFWIPQLSGQIYAMSGMETQLHLIANSIGTFPGRTTEINGSGYEGMHFNANVVTKNDFAAWVQQVKKYGNTLNLATYNQLSQPTEENPTSSYATVDKNLYTIIIEKYLLPTGTKLFQ